MKNSIDIMGNRTRNLPACSAVPQPTASLRALHYVVSSICIIDPEDKGITFVQNVCYCLYQPARRNIQQDLNLCQLRHGNLTFRI
jgi:hypothetical protein